MIRKTRFRGAYVLFQISLAQGRNFTICLIFPRGSLAGSNGHTRVELIQHPAPLNLPNCNMGYAA